MSLHLRTPSTTARSQGAAASNGPSSVYSIFVTPEPPLPPPESYRRRRGSRRKEWKSTLLITALLLGVFLLEWRYLSTFGQKLRTTNIAQGKRSVKKAIRPMFERLLALGAHALAEGASKEEPRDLWKEPSEASMWKPCADVRSKGYAAPPDPRDSSGYITISADGGLNQQRVAVCNGVAVARLLNATLVLPRFLFNSVWRDNSQFGDIYQEKLFIDYLKDDVHIVKELPLELRSLDLTVMGANLSNADVHKESTPRFFLETVMPLLIRNRVVHFEGFENSLSFDPMPSDIQKLRCRCNFHALKFVPKLQSAAGIMIKRMRDKSFRWGPVEQNPSASSETLDVESRLLESHTFVTYQRVQDAVGLAVVDDRSVRNRYLALHLRFEIDMAACSLCDFNGGEEERQELEAYRQLHFPILTERRRNGQLLPAAVLREEGKCPLTPEEGVLMLAALGFKRSTRIFLAGAHIYGGAERMAVVRNLYPNIVTKENVLTAEELLPFVNHSSQMAALDFIGCAAADAFAMTDSGSQLSSLVSGYRTYFGPGHLPSIRPNKRRLAIILSDNTTVEWEVFEEKVRKSVSEGKRPTVRPYTRSVYRNPRCKECMCLDSTSE